MSTPVLQLAGLRFDPVARRYRLPSGRFESTERTLAVLEGQVEATTKAMRADAEALQAGRLSLAEWQLAMEGRIKSLHLLTASLEHGGFAQLSRADLGWIGQRVREQYAFLARFAREIESGAQALDGRLLARVDLYASAGRATQREAASRIAVLAGASERARILGPADHCVRSGDKPGCIDQARLGFLPIGDARHVKIGACVCATRCRCSWSFRPLGVSKSAL